MIGASPAQMHELILNSAAEGIVALDRDGIVVVFVNPAAARMLDQEPEGLIGKPLHERFRHRKPDGPLYAWEECPVGQTLQEGMTSRTDHEVLWTRGDANFPVEYTSAPIREAGGIVGAVVTFHDITERKLLERPICRSNWRTDHPPRNASAS